MTTGTVQLPPKFDLFELARNGDPYSVYAKLRAAGPLLRGGPGVWVVPRYREVAALLRDSRLGAFRFQEVRRLYQRASPDSPLDEGSANSFLDSVMIAKDGSDHARLRVAVSRSFTHRLTADLRARIKVLASKLIDNFNGDRAVDVVSNLAYPLPLTVLGELFGIPHTDRDRVGREVLKLSKLFSPIVTDLDKSSADKAVVWLRQFMELLFDQRIAAPTDDMVSDMAAAVKDRMLTREEAIDNTIFLIFAGLETSTSLIATGCLALANHPEQFAKLRNHPECVQTAVEEFLRYDAPTQITARIVREPIKLEGRTLGKGRVLLLLLGSANHDERQFRSPAQLDIERTSNSHVSFGAGGHYCLGAGLANLESAAVFDLLAQRFSSFELEGEAVREPCATPRIYLNIPVCAKSR